MNAIDLRALLADPVQSGAYFIDDRDTAAMAQAGTALDFGVARIDLSGCGDKTELLAAHRGLHTDAPVMTAHDDVFYLENVYRVIEYAEHVHVGMNHHVGDVAMDEDVARLGTCYFICRDPAVGASDP